MSGPPATALTVVLVRHAQPQGVRPKSFLGHSDPDLGPEGRAQAAATADCLGRLVATGDLPPPAALWASDLQRARSSAEPIAEALALSAQIDPRLREIDFGIWDGASFKEVDERHDGAASDWFAAPMAGTPEAGEHLSAVVQRTGAWLAEQAARPPGGPLVVVGHFGSLAMLAGHLLGLDPPTALRVVLQRGECGCISGGALRWWGLPRG